MNPHEREVALHGTELPPLEEIYIDKYNTLVYNQDANKSIILFLHEEERYLRGNERSCPLSLT